MKKKIIDTAAGLPLTPATVAAAALNLIGSKEPPMACCPEDGEPLISTFRYAGAEFVCMVCGSLLGFLSPTPKDVTPELTERHDFLRKQFDAGVRPGSVEHQAGSGW